MCEAADASELFDAVFTGDNLISKPRIDAIVFLSLVAGRTRRVTLGTACMASFVFRHPIVLANQWAALDLLSDGRTPPRRLHRGRTGHPPRAALAERGEVGDGVRRPWG